MQGSPQEGKTTKDLLRKVEEERARDDTSPVPTEPALTEAPKDSSQDAPKESRKRTFADYLKRQKEDKLMDAKRAEEKIQDDEETASSNAPSIKKTTDDAEIEAGQKKLEERHPELTWEGKISHLEPADDSNIADAEDLQEDSNAIPNPKEDPEVVKTEDLSAITIESEPSQEKAIDSTPSRKTGILLSSELSPLPSTYEDLKSKLPASIPEDHIPERETKREHQETSIPPDEDSDAETVHDGSPVRKRGRLVRKSEIESSPKHAKKVDFDDDDEYMDDDDDNSELGVPKRKKKPYGKLQRSSRSSSPHRQARRTKGGRDHSGRRMLQRVCEKGLYDQAKMLIEDGADVNDQDNAGNSALHEAALLGFTDIVELLLEHGAIVDLQNGPDDLDTPLIDAAANGHVETVKVLLNYGADPRIENSAGQNALDSLEEGGAVTDNLKKMLRDQTIKLTKEGRRFESGNNSDVDERSRSRSRPRIGGSRRVPSSRSDILWMDFTSKSGLEEVYRRASDGDMQFVGNYLQNVAKPDTEALALAAKFGHTDVVNLFLAFGAKVDLPNENGQTALMRTVGRGHLETVKLLLDAGAKVTRTSKDGKNALDYAMNSLMVNDEEIEMLQAAMNGQPLKVPTKETHTEKQISLKEEDNENSTDSRKLQKVKKRKLSTKEDFHEHSPESKKKKIAKVESSQPPELKSGKSTETITSTSAQLASKSEAKRVMSGVKLDLKPVVKEPERPAPPPPPETEEEKKARLEKEKDDRKLREKYEADRIAKRKAREQEFLSNFESEEKKKEEELRKLSQLEQERREKEAKAQEAKIREQQRMKEEKLKTEEIEKIHKLRESYPTGLRRTRFSKDVRSKEDALQYMPLYKVSIEGIYYLIDLQVIMALGLEDFKLRYKDNIYGRSKLLSKNEKSKAFQLLAPLLCNPSTTSVTKRIENYDEELSKFSRLVVSWIEYDAVVDVIETDFKDLVGLFRSRCVDAEIEGLKDTFAKPHEPTTQKGVSGSKPVFLDSQQKLPLYLRVRPAVMKALTRNKKLW